MKQIFSTLFLAVVFFASASAQTPVVTGPAIEVNETTHDYGALAFNGDGHCEFVVTNTGTEPLIISECKKSCGCTTPQCDSNPIAPGATSVIKVKYDTKRPGPFNKSVTVTSNAVNEPVLVLHIKGTVDQDPSASASGAPVKTVSGAPNEGK